MPTSLAGIKASDLQEGLDFQIVLRKTYDGSNLIVLANYAIWTEQRNKQKNKQTNKRQQRYLYDP